MFVPDLCSCQVLISSGQADLQGEVLSPAAVMQLLAVRLNPLVLSRSTQIKEYFVKASVLREVHLSCHLSTTKHHPAETHQTQRIWSQLLEVLIACILTMRGHIISSCYSWSPLFLVNSERFILIFTNCGVECYLCILLKKSCKQIGNYIHKYTIKIS